MVPAKTLELRLLRIFCIFKILTGKFPIINSYLFIVWVRYSSFTYRSYTFKKTLSLRKTSNQKRVEAAETHDNYGGGDDDGWLSTRPFIQEGCTSRVDQGSANPFGNTSEDLYFIL